MELVKCSLRFVLKTDDALCDIDKVIATYLPAGRRNADAIKIKCRYKKDYCFAGNITITNIIYHQISTNETYQTTAYNIVDIHCSIL